MLLGIDPRTARTSARHRSPAFNAIVTSSVLRRSIVEFSEQRYNAA
jgi:hypothetical protein